MTQRYFKKDLPACAGYLLCVPLSCFASVAFALSIQPVLDSILGGDAARFWQGAAVFAAWGLVDIALLLVVERLALRLLKSSRIALKEDLFAAVLRMPYQTYRAQSKDALSILTNDAGTIADCRFSSLLSLYRIFWSFLFSILTSLQLSPLITAVVLAVGVVSVWVPRLLGRKIDRMQLSLSQERETYSKTVQDTFDGLAAIKTTGTEGFFARRHGRRNQTAETLAYRIDRDLAFAGWFSGLCSSAAYIATLVLGGWLAMQGRMTAGLIVSLSQLIGGVVAPLEQVPALLTRIRSVRSVCQKCQDLLDGAAAAPFARGGQDCLTCRDVTFHYPGTHNGVEAFGHTFVPGKKYLLTGASGGGKSTVAQLVAGLYRCEAGTVEYPCTLRSAREVLYVPQQAHVFQDTLRNNLALGEDFTEDAMREALRACCLTEFLAGLPNGLDEVLRDRYACSGGEAARLGLARAILRRPKILICDEVTAHLDGATAQQIDALLTSLPGVLLLNVSHKISEAAAGRYDEVLRLENGRLVESGPPPAGNRCRGADL